MDAAPAGADLADTYTSITRYYTAKILRHGATPRGVDWTCTATQELRFVQLLRICGGSSRFSLNDIGCGYGAVLAYFDRWERTATVDYLGLDLSATMIRHARRLWGERAHTRFVVGTTSPRAADYAIASGLFNVRLHEAPDRWTAFIARTLADMAATSRRGFAANFMAPKDRAEDDTAELYRSVPAPWIEYCERVLGGSVELVAGYGLREFTLLVRS
ncbi:MAG: class I SAM-dependent methyltransferase [Alphaproteobacteria bacterium]|nr:class I SAM-dependent methyltransferase [Alphaproteobacteria bacterium]